MRSNERKTLRWCFLALMILLTANIHLFAQVKFKVALLPDNVTYRISMLPETTWTPPLNITSTAQVTLKVPTGGFEISGLTSLTPSTYWSNNAFYESPLEAPNFDYISFGLTSLGTTGFVYEAGVEVPLFEFVNSGICTGPLEIMLDNDPFFPPNSINANVNNQITTFGTGSGNNGFSGSYDLGSANCTPDAGCQVAFELDALPDGRFQISMMPDATWGSPDNTTDTLRVSLSAYHESFSVVNLESLVSGVDFELGNIFEAPTQSPQKDYFIIRMTSHGTDEINYSAGTKTPLFTFSNGGTCLGDSLRVVDPLADPFAQANSNFRSVVQTTGSMTMIEACPMGDAQPLLAGVIAVNPSSPTGCDVSNGTISISAFGADDLEYSIDNGATWQGSSLFTNLIGGNYYVSVRKGDGSCERDFTGNPVELATLISPIIDDIIFIQPVGCGNNNGSIFIQASGGDLEYSIDGGSSWSNINVFTSLAPGNYQPVVRNDDGSCEVFGDAIVLNSGGDLPDIASVTSTEPTDCSGSDGSISIEANGNDLEFSINNGLTWFNNGEYEMLGEGNYNVLVRDGVSGCIAVHPGNPINLFKTGCPGCTVEYKLEVLPSGMYQVSVIPHATWNFPQNITSTAQVTIVVPTGGFVVSNLTNLQPGVTFNDNVRIDQPIENPGFDYIAFGLETLGTTGIPYVDGVEVPLFTFENGGVCTGPGIYLMDDNTDPFVPPNSQSSNVGQQLTTVGSGQDAFVCLVDPGYAPCLPDVVGDLEAIDDAFDLFANTSFGDEVVNNDLYSGSGMLSVSQIPISATTFGSLSLNMDGSFSYTPDPGFVGTDQFEYLICDNGTPAICDTGLVVLNINPALLAVDDFYSVTTGNLLIDNLLTNDFNLAGNQWQVNLTPLVPPAFGSVSLSANGEFTYSPNSGYVGNDEFQYVVCQNTAVPLCDTAKVFITVLQDLDAEDDFFDVPIGGDVTATVIDNDFLPTGASYNVDLIPSSGPQNGSLILNPDGIFTYTPNAGYLGSDQFSYAVCEDGNPSNCDVATVYMNVLDGLTAIDDSFIVMPNITYTDNTLVNDLIPIGMNTQAVLLLGSGPDNGLLTFNGNGDFEYTPNPGYEGMDNYEYIIFDIAAPQIRDTGEVILEVFKDLTGVNDIVIVSAGNDATGNVQDNDLTGGSDVTTSILPGAGPSNGTVVLNPNGEFTYSPNPGFSGEDVFEYEICMANMPSVCDTATVEISVISIAQGLPTPIINCPTAYCSDGELNLSISQNYSGTIVSYNWFNADGALVSLEEEFSLPANSPLAVPPFRVRVVVDGNLSQLSAPCEVEKVNSPMAIVSVNGPFCSGDDVQLFADQQPNYQYEWRIAGQSDLLSTQANPFIFNILYSTDYELTVFNNACPNQATTTVSVQVNPTPDITDIVGGGTYCHGETVTLSAGNGTPMSNDLTYTWTGPDGFFFTSPASANDDFAITLATLVPENEGAYTLTLTTDEGCSPPAQSVIVDYVPIPETPELLVVNNQLCEGETLELNSSLLTGNSVIYDWYLDIGSGANQLGSTTYPTFFIPAVNASESGNYHVVAQVDGCESEPSNLEGISVTQTSFQASNPTIISVPACEGADIPLSTPIIPGASYQWYGPNGFEATVPNPVIDGAEIVDGGEYVAVVNIPNCNTEVVSATEVFIAPMPNEPFLTNNGPVCEGSDLVLSVTDPDVSGSVTYRFYFEPTNTMVGTSTDGTLMIPGAAPTDSGLYFSMAEQGGCIADPANMSGVSVDGQPANAAVGGTGEIVCGLTDEIELEAIPPSFGTGFWTSPTGATPVNPDQPNTPATGLEEGDNVFVWALSSGSCLNFSVDTVVITVVDVPDELAVAGPDLVICGENEVILTASPSASATSQWSQPAWQEAAGVNISDPDSLEPEVSGLEDGQVYTFSWNLSFGECQNYSTDEVIVTVNTAPNEIAYISENELFICDEATIELNASPIVQSTGTWAPLNGAAITSLNSPSTLASNLQPGANQFVWSIETDECPVFSIDTVTVFNEELELLADSYMVSVGDSVEQFSPTDNDFLQNIDDWELEIVAMPRMGELRQNTDGTFTYLPYPSAFGEDEMMYRVCSQNCPDICDMVTVRFVIDATPTSPEDCFAPNTITPNNDGINDQFIVPCAAAYPGSTCTIFNRWGDPVYESKNYGNDWEGTYDGRPVPVGTYFYVIKLNNGEESLMCGYLAVMRE